MTRFNLLFKMTALAWTKRPKIIFLINFIREIHHILNQDTDLDYHLLNALWNFAEVMLVYKVSLVKEANLRLYYRVKTKISREMGFKLVYCCFRFSVLYIPCKDEKN